MLTSKSAPIREPTPSPRFVFISDFFGLTLVLQQPYKNPAHFDVESDASSSTYALVMAAITGGKVTALNVTSKSLQVLPIQFRAYSNDAC